jgi:hypothetical protein
LQAIDAARGRAGQRGQEQNCGKGGFHLWRNLPGAGGGGKFKMQKAEGKMQNEETGAPCEWGMRNLLSLAAKTLKEGK